MGRLTGRVAGDAVAETAEGIVAGTKTEEEEEEGGSRMVAGKRTVQTGEGIAVASGAVKIGSLVAEAVVEVVAGAGSSTTAAAAVGSESCFVAINQR